MAESKSLKSPPLSPSASSESERNEHSRSSLSLSGEDHSSSEESSSEEEQVPPTKEEGSASKPDVVKEEEEVVVFAKEEVDDPPTVVVVKEELPSPSKAKRRSSTVTSKERGSSRSNTSSEEEEEEFVLAPSPSKLPRRAEPTSPLALSRVADAQELLESSSAEEEDELSSPAKPASMRKAASPSLSSSGSGSGSSPSGSGSESSPSGSDSESSPSSSGSSESSDSSDPSSEEEVSDGEEASSSEESAPSPISRRQRKNSSPSVEPLAAPQIAFQRKPVASAVKSSKSNKKKESSSSSSSPSSSSSSSSSGSSHSSSSSSSGASNDSNNSDNSDSDSEEDDRARHHRRSTRPPPSKFATCKQCSLAMCKRFRMIKCSPSLMVSLPLVLRDDIQELKRASKLGSLGKQITQQLKTRTAFTRLLITSVLLVLVILGLLPMVLNVGGGFSLRDNGLGPPKEDFPPNWKRGKQLSLTELMELIPVYDNSLRNDSSVKIKKMPTLDKPEYLSVSAKDLVQIKRPAVRKKRPDEPRAVRTFGCLRDGCRGLEIEDLLDRGWQMRFRAAQKNDTYKSINYRVTFLLTDTTQLNHMRSVRPDLYEAIYNSYERKSYLIAFDGADAIGGNKGQQLKVKERFVRKYGCKFSELAISPASFRLYLHEECEDLIQLSAKATWLLKPEAGSQGQGITFHTEVADIMNKQPKFFPCKKDVEYKATERFLVQEYIEKPLLLRKCKFDARVYMNVASSNPFLVFYHEGYLRRALAPYTALSRDRRVYLTNTHFQSMKKDFKLSEHIWSFPEFGAYLKEQGRTGGHYIESILNPQIKKIALFIFMSARQKLKKRRGTFHIMGLDFMVDEDFHVWFIEANGFPGFTWSINFDTRTMVEEWFNLAQQVHENPRFYQLMREGDRYGGFEMIFSELEEEQTQNMYNPCQEFKFNRGYTQPLKEANRLFAQISGKGGKTEKFKHFTTPWKQGGQYLGGLRSDQLLAREEYFAKYRCKKNSVHFGLAEFALYREQDCKSFFNEYGQSNYAWIVKPIVGTVEEFRIFANIEAMRQEYESCVERPADVIVQRLVGNRPLVLYKWWDIKVYMLVASTKPYFVFYHQGYARTSKLSYVEGGEAIRDSSTSVGGEEDDTEEEVVELDEDGGEDDNSPEVPGGTATTPALSSSSLPLPDGTAGDGSNVDGTPINPYIILPPAEPWAPKATTTGAQFSLDEEYMTLEKLEDEMARADMVGSKWLSSVFDTYAKRTALLLFQATRAQAAARSNQTYQLVQMNFLLDHKMQIHFVSSKNVDADAFPNVDVLQEERATFMETMAGLVLELHAMPLAFSRIRRGDSYGGWRNVFSEIEEKQRSLDKTYNPCDEFKPNLQVSKSSLFKDAWLHQHTLKSHARNKRELRKYVERKWTSTCAHKPTAELRASCIRNTISFRYKQYIEKERIPYQDGYVENHIRELQNRASQPKSSQGGGL
ncbi:hypothetical protein BASA81_008885 [Batrachochytrium salamandrivorans]|nr:hypothetical protein BASA81_008885 [Batrachochytrium salamandrivorans]